MLITLCFIINLYTLNIKLIFGCIIISAIPTLIIFCIYKLGKTLILEYRK